MLSVGGVVILSVGGVAGQTTVCVCKLRAENNLAMSHQSDSESGTGGLECVTDDSRQTTPASASIAVAGSSQLSLGGASGSTSSSSDLPPAPKRTKRASKWQEEWKKYNMKQSKRGFICLL